jgi:hypothetical protein
VLSNHSSCEKCRSLRSYTERFFSSGLPLSLILL